MEISYTLSITDIISSLTFIVITIYVIYTYKIFKQTKFQTDISINPLIIFEIKEDRFYIKNIGNGIALNIKIDNFIIKDNGNIFTLKFESVNLLEPKGNLELKYKNYKNDEETNFDLLSAHLIKEHQYKYNIDLTIEYENVIGKKCYCKFSTGKDGIKFHKIKYLS